jgi:hypothetical protein
MKVVEETKTHILRSITFFRESRRLWDNVENVVETEGQPMMSQHGAYALHAGLARLRTRPGTHMHARTPPPPPRTQTYK